MNKVLFYTKSFKSKNSIINLLKENSNLLLFVSVFVSGIIIGACILSTNLDIGLKITKVISENCIVFKNEKEYLMINILFSIMSLLFTFICGLSAIGFPFIVIFTLLQGVYFGILAGSYTIIYESKGIAIFILTNLVSISIFIAIYLYSCCTSIKMTSYLSSVITKNSNREINIKNYIISFAVYILIGILSCIIGLIFRLIFNPLTG